MHRSDVNQEAWSSVNGPDGSVDRSDWRNGTCADGQPTEHP